MAEGEDPAAALLALHRVEDPGPVEAHRAEGEHHPHARAHVAPYKLPRRFVFVDEIARSPSGKADYRWAKARALEEDGTLQSSP